MRYRSNNLDICKLRQFGPNHVRRMKQALFQRLIYMLVGWSGGTRREGERREGVRRRGGGDRWQASKTTGEGRENDDQTETTRTVQAATTVLP